MKIFSFSTQILCVKNENFFGYKKSNFLILNCVTMNTFIFLTKKFLHKFTQFISQNYTCVNRHINRMKYYEDTIKVSSIKIQEKKKYTCEYCENIFTTRQALSRHKNGRCDKKVIKKQNDEIIELLKKDNEYLKSLLEKAENIISSAIATAKTSANALNYIILNYGNAPILTPIQNYNLMEEYCGDYGIANAIIELYADSKLIKFLSDIIVNNYKKENPQEQSLWNSDCNRLSYIIRTIVGNKNGWITDKKGIKLKELVISHLLLHIETELWNFMEKTQDNIVENSKKLGLCVKLLKEIKDCVLCNDLIKFLAPYFQLTRTIESSQIVN